MQEAQLQGTGLGIFGRPHEQITAAKIKRSEKHEQHSTLINSQKSMMKVT